MTESWRTALERLAEIGNRRDLTQREEVQWRDAQRKRAKEMLRSRAAAIVSEPSTPEGSV